MTCREAHIHLSAERDGPLPASHQAGLAAHLAACPACRRAQTDLIATIGYWHAGVAQAPAPDPEKAWWAVRREIRARPSSRNRWGLLTRTILPLAAAAAIALALLLPSRLRTAPPGSSAAPMARADSVEVPGPPASTMVFVDDKSGWLIVWASDEIGAGG